MTEKKIILAIDDDPMYLGMLTDILSPHYTLMVSKSAAEAMALLEKNRPDLILLDIAMPNISGFEFLHDIKQNPKWLLIPVIVVSGHTNSHFVERAEKIGANCVVGKPIEKDVLLEKIKEALDNPKKGLLGL